MIYNNKLVAFLALCVATAASHSPRPGQRIHQDAPLLTIKDYAEPVLQKRGSSLKRQDSVGSWALRARTCPTNTEKCDGGFPAMAPCCPKDSVCVVYLFRIACCATSDRCDITASTFPKCGDSSWTLWGGGRDRYFCCQPGEIGYITTDDSGACGPDNLKPTGTQIATSLVQAGGQDQPPKTSAPNTPTEENPPVTADGSSVPTDPNSPVTSSFGTTDNAPTNPTGTSGTSDNQDGTSDGSSSPTNTSSSSGSSGLPTGAIVGIAVGAVLILILAGVAIYFALKAGRKKGAAEAMAAFQQQQQRSLPGGHTYQSGITTPGAGVPPMSQPPPPQGYGQQTHLKPDGTSVTAEKYGEAVIPNGPPPQWSASTDPQGGPRYEADATNTYPGTTYSEMEGYNNNQGRY